MRLPMASLLEGFVSQLLADYLSNYVKGIYPEQFRLGIWNGVAQLENLELRLEAFDYLQLPIAIKKGVVGKLQIQVPWKKLGWEPILIAVEDIFICACPRDEFEWKSEALEARSLAAKKAKLAAAELSKLSARISGRMSDDNSNQSFFSYLSTKILDNIQVTANNVHIRYIDEKTDPEVAFSFGVMFSNLIINTDHVPSVPSVKSRPNVVNKLFIVKGFSIYWNSDENSRQNSTEKEDNAETTDFPSQNKCVYLIHPFDASLTLMVNKNAPMDGSNPQFSVTFETNDLNFTLEDRQLREMLLLWDALSICKMRERYGRLRPAIGQPGFNRKDDGWQKVWWRYAVEAVLIDVRKNLRRNSWSYLGWRMDMRRKYVALYKEKLNYFWKGKPAASESLSKLEELEKELDVEEILSFRSSAESSLQRQVSNMKHEESVSEIKSKDSVPAVDEQSSQTQRSWLNFLSLGMLGAAGSTAASEQFAGVLPDEIIEDIYEATKYNPKGHTELPKGYCQVDITSLIKGAVITLRGLQPREDIASLELQLIELRVKMWQQSTNYFATIKELKVTDLCQKSSAYPVVLGNSGMVLPHFSETGHRRLSYAEAVSGVKQNSNMPIGSGIQPKWEAPGALIEIEVEVLSDHKDYDVVVKVALQPLEFVYSPILMKRMGAFINRPTSVQTLKDLIFSSLDRLQSPQIRLQTKAELAVAMGKRVSLQVDVQRPVIIYPKAMESLDCNHMIIIVRSIHIKSLQPNSTVLGMKNIKMEYSSMQKKFQHGMMYPKSSMIGMKQDGSDKKWFNESIYSALYNQFHFQFCGVQVILTSHSYKWLHEWQGPDEIEKFHLARCFDAEAMFEICSLPDEPSLTRCKLSIHLPSLELTFSSKKWVLLKSLFSTNSEDDCNHADITNNPTRVLSITDDTNIDGLTPSCHNPTAAKFELAVIAKTLIVAIHPDFEFMEETSNLRVEGEHALLLFTHTDLQQELHFSTLSVHMDKACRKHDYYPLFSLHSASHMSISGTFVPATIWKFEFGASDVSIILNGDIPNSERELTVLDFKDVHLLGSWQEESLDALNLKIQECMILSALCDLEINNFNEDHRASSDCSLCSAHHRYVVQAVEQQRCRQLVVCMQIDNQYGLEVCCVLRGEDTRINLSMPSFNVNAYMNDWARCMQSLLLLFGNEQNQTFDDQMQTPEYVIQNVDHEISVPASSGDSYVKSKPSKIIFKSSAICMLIHLPDTGHTSAHPAVYSKPNCHASDIAKEQMQKFASIRITFVVDNSYYNDPDCGFDISVQKCEINLNDNIPGCVSCLPLLQIVDVQVKANASIKSVPRQSVKMTASLMVKKLDIWCSHPILCFLRSFKFEEVKARESTVEFESLTVNSILERGSLLLTDGRWNCNAPIFEFRIKSVDSTTTWKPEILEYSTVAQLELDYHDMEKVAWEPFLERWNFSVQCLLNLSSKKKIHNLISSFSSSSELNINITKALLQAVSRAMDLFSDISENFRGIYSPSRHNFTSGYAPYWLQNDTGVCISYWLDGALKLDNNNNGREYLGTNILQPGSSIPIYIEETLEQLFHTGRAHSSTEKLNDKKALHGQHRMIRVQIEGTSKASSPMSMDLVGSTIFHISFAYPSKDSLNSKSGKGNIRTDRKVDGEAAESKDTAFCTPVVYEVSCHNYSKIIRIYSTVSLVNATSIPMEVRFDIPFGLVPKIMEPILPGQAVPLPVHLAETGQIKWRPIVDGYFWSEEAQSLSNILTAAKQSTLRPFVSYNKSLSALRCCITVHDSMVTSLTESSLRGHIQNLATNTTDMYTGLEATNSTRNKIPSSSPVLRELTFQAPFLFRNCLPLPINFTIESNAGLQKVFYIKEGDSAFVLEVNTGHDLTLTLSLPGFLPAKTKIAAAIGSAENHSEAHHGLLASIETLKFVPSCSGGCIVYGKSEILSNFVSGAREVTLSVPFWLYNFSGQSLVLIDEDGDFTANNTNDAREQVISSHPISARDNKNPISDCLGLQTILQTLPTTSRNQISETTPTRFISCGKSIISCLPSKTNATDDDKVVYGPVKLEPYMYSPSNNNEPWEKRVRARVGTACSRKPAERNDAGWSRPFSLNPPGGMTTIVIPSAEQEGGLILSVVSAATQGASQGKTQTITFQPRYVLANMCSQDLCYRQQGTNESYFLLRRNHANLSWSDMSRPLLMTVRFDQHGWDWSGAFEPDVLGDTQLKVRNLVTGATQVLRAEIQNASSLDNEINDISSTDNSLGTYLILLSDDKSGFMPYRIDNFSLERIRFHQIKCPEFESVLLPYSSCPYAWDEPWRPHQLVLEIPGEGCLGTFNLDEVKEYTPIRIPAKSQKPERQFLVSVHAEGPLRVLMFQDVTVHPKKDNIKVIEQSTGDQAAKHGSGVDYKLSFCLASIGVSIIDTTPKEILFMSARGFTLQLVQGSRDQRMDANISYIQMDNQLTRAQYPVMFTAGKFERSSSSTNELEESSNVVLSEFSAFSLSIKKWRHLASSVDCFQKIYGRLAPVQVQLDEHILRCLYDFFRSPAGANHIVRLDGDNQAGFADSQSSLGFEKFESMLESKPSQLRLVKVLKWKELYQSWPAARAIKCLQNENLKLFCIARGGKKVYIENLYIAPIEVTVSFSTVPWTHEHSPDFRLFWNTGASVQRGLMALIDIEGAPVQLGELSLAHPLARWDTIRGMIAKHYTRQLLHEIYKVLGSAGFLGNPMGFIKSLGSGVRDFVSAPAKSFVKNPKQLAGGLALGTQSLVSNTVFAVSSAATLMSRAARKGVTALALGHQHEPGFQESGVIGELLEGLTGLLQSPVTGAERHGIPGILSGVAVGAVGLVARPVASILEAAGRTAQSIRSWSQPIQQAKRIRPPRYLCRDSPIHPYSWEEAVGHAVLLESADPHLLNQVYITCRPLEQPSKYILLTENVLLIVSTDTSHDRGKLGSEWKIDQKFAIEDILHVEKSDKVLEILLGSPRFPPKTSTYTKKQTPILGPVRHECIEMAQIADAEEISLLVNKLAELHMKNRTLFLH